MNKCGRGSLGGASYQISRLWVLWFQTGRFFHVSPYHFWPPAHNLNKLGRGPLGDATYQYQGFRSEDFRQEDFFQCFPYISICKQCDPGAGPFLVKGA